MTKQIKIPITPEGRVQLNTQAEHLEMSVVYLKRIADHFGIEQKPAGYYFQIRPVEARGHLYLIEKAERLSQKKLDNFSSLLFRNGRATIFGTLYEHKRHGDLKNVASFLEGR